MSKRNWITDIHEGDFIDTVLSLGSIFNWIKPVINSLCGYNTKAYHFDSFDTALTQVDILREQGYKTTWEGDIFVGYTVRVKE